MIYAKLFYWAMVREMFTFSNTQAVATANVIGGNPEWVNLANLNLEPYLQPDTIVSCKIVLIDGVDIPYSTSETTRRLLCWLAWAGSRINGDANNATPHACYMQWPAIPIVVLGRAAEAPAIPAAALPTSNELIQFSMGLADRRQEWSSLNRGLYSTMDLIGMGFNDVAGHFWPLKSDLSPRNPTLPAPRDYNFMFRMLQKYPEVPNHDVKSEATSYSTLASVDRVHAFALYTAVRATATTTFLYDLNLRIADLNQWTCGAADTDEILAAVVGQGLNDSDVTVPNSEPVAVSQPKKAFKLWLGVGVEDRLYPQTKWLGDAGELGANAVHRYAGVVTIPPRFCSPLVIWNWPSIRPIEWRFVGLSPTINLRNEIRTQPPAGRIGRYSDMGSSVYAEKAISDAPTELVVYGAQAINAICQYLRRAAANAP